MIDLAVGSSGQDNETTPGAIRRGNEFDVYQLPDGLNTDIEHFKAMVRKVQNDSKFREGLEEYHKARVAALAREGVPADKVGAPIWLVAARNPEKYRAVLDRLEVLQAWATIKHLRRVKENELAKSNEGIITQRKEAGL
jgi:hypothetical protein